MMKEVIKNKKDQNKSVKLAEYKKNLTQPLPKATICFLVREDKVLLAMKKRGFGEGKYNGTGGKQKEGEVIKQTAVRETQEEIGVTPISLRQMAILDFYNPSSPDWNQQVYVFLVDEWKGEPKESEEMAPEWFKIENLPLDSMWPDDVRWMPKVLAGESFTAELMFGENDRLVELNFRSS